MNREFFTEVCEAFLAARAVDGQRRTLVLAEKCGGNAAVREEVERLLAADGHRSDALDDSAMVDGINLEAFQGIVSREGGSAGPSREQELPAMLGRFRIIRKLGEGGMGLVCEAEQDNPRRLVALKLLRSGYVSTGLSRRFAHEAQVLAKLQHPGIARIYETGTAPTATGVQPYFAMELINGRPLLDHVAAAGLGVTERLKLFLLVCEAVEYAHRKGVIHRDLKPANILVDEHGNPRILDFGVARVTDSDLQVSTMETDPGQLVGTLPYMSPEQVAGNTDLVDTRTDVYALGIILFQLLAGRLPYETRNKSIAEAARIVREQEPTRLGTLHTQFRGDLETIVARALEKDVSRRYQSAAALGADVGRFLSDQPILARPASRAYQIRKFARRHPELVAGLSMAILVGLLGLIGTAWGLLRATAQRDVARAQAAKASRLAGAMERILEAANPGSAAGYFDGPVEILTQAARDVGQELAGDPDSEWAVRMALARSFHGLGATEARTYNLRIADDLARRYFPPQDSRVAESGRSLATAFVDFITEGVAPEDVKRAADQHIRRALEEARQMLGNDHPITVSLLSDRAYLALYTGDPEATVLHQELVSTLRRFPADRRPCPLAFALSRLAYCLGCAQEEAPALAAAEEALSLVRSGLEPGDELTLSRQLGLHDILLEYGRVREVIELLEENIARVERARGKAHPSVRAMLVTLSGLYHRLGEHRKARMFSGEALAVRRAVSGRRAPATYFDLTRHGNYLAWDQQYDEALSTLMEAIEIVRLHEGPESFQNESWCAAQLVCGLRSTGPWSSECLRAEAHFAFRGCLSGGTPSRGAAEVRWDALSFVLKRLDPNERGTFATGGLTDLWSTPQPPNGLYYLDMRVPVLDQTTRVFDWVLVTPWQVRKYASRFRDLTKADQWALCKAAPPDEVVEMATLTAVGWPCRDLGPLGRPYHFGLVAETTIDLPPGTYEFALAADNCGALYLDDERLLDTWAGSGDPSRGITNAQLGPGPHKLRVEYVQGGGLACLRLRVRPSPAGQQP